MIVEEKDTVAMFHVNNLPHVERPATLVTTANLSEQFTSSFEKVSSLVVDSRCRIIFLFSGVSLIFLLLLAVENCPVISGHLEFVCFYFEPLKAD